jgi:hypothetical protein
MAYGCAGTSSGKTRIGVWPTRYIETLSSGVLRGTNPAHAVDRHNAVMLEAARLREISKIKRNEQARAALAARHVRPALPLAPG